ncbi:MAG TPA: ATP-binding cassette domain-containing protein, partial [Pilimelia sp.]|nr:ATP-binding cassette domain-containing protein [Pilimelia sp.]
MTDQAGLRLDGVHAAHGTNEVLHGIDLSVGRTELLVVLGPSGAGKSTLLRVIAGLEPATRGRVV